MTDKSPWATTALADTPTPEPTGYTRFAPGTEAELAETLVSSQDPFHKLFGRLVATGYLTKLLEFAVMEVAVRDTKPSMIYALLTEVGANLFINFARMATPEKHMAEVAPLLGSVWGEIDGEEMTRRLLDTGKDNGND